ncbi:hypothetical protein CBM2637_B60023 [Cupriavidus taiwanensis]|uniref:hypothetical protein n=1 Tax=Cupriavidus taiwanensis TaxID=164546 RepID=UPI000E164442|nr:hypothetical protein [Cupriavidus taiwanensis]SPA34293.1 hypothetical protein CBM2637_B60023 [Cupriavidus taiwanensis]
MQASTITERIRRHPRFGELVRRRARLLMAERLRNLGKFTFVDIISDRLPWSRGTIQPLKPGA